MIEILISPWIIVGLIGYVLIARFKGWPFRWLGVGAITLLALTAGLVAWGDTANAEHTAQASYAWFVAFAVGLILDTIRPQKHIRPVPK